MRESGREPQAGDRRAIVAKSAAYIARVGDCDDLARAAIADGDTYSARGSHRGPRLPEDLVELLERAPARLDAEQEPQHRRAHVPDDEHEVVLVPPALQPDRVRERVDEPRRVRDQDVHCGRGRRKRRAAR